MIVNKLMLNMFVNYCKVLYLRDMNLAYFFNET